MKLPKFNKNSEDARPSLKAVSDQSLFFVHRRDIADHEGSWKIDFVVRVRRVFARSRK